MKSSSEKGSIFKVFARVLSLEEALAYIPPPLTFCPNFVKRNSSTNPDIPGDHKLVELLPWKGFFEKVNNFKFGDESKYNRPIFINYSQMYNEMSIQTAFETNICEVLNKLLRNYDFSRESTKNPGDPDFICHFAMLEPLMPIEVKRKHILEYIGSFIEFYKHNKKAQSVIKQIYSYMVVNQVKFGILSTYDNHWFLRQLGDNEENRARLWISEALPLESHSPPVLKAYAYVTKKLCMDMDAHSSHTNIITVPAYENNGKRITRNIRKSAQKKESSDSSSIQNFYFTDFKFKDLLSQGRSGKTLLCEFRNNTIALKCADLWKSPSYILKEMQNEVKIYQQLSDLQGIYIPNLECYGYFENGMCYVIGTTLVGKPLSFYKYITKGQKVKGMLALNAIHDRGVLHNDIRADNILLDNRNNDVYLIDFGMSNTDYDIMEDGVFNEEKFKLDCLLTHYTL
ncbi:kinase-like protein [Rhizophagus irregularis]|uniref:Kinase-like protein n=1 Tax=Rhizophagus irregularis TaxID=588596 RepID=A0A2N0P037_9GLOM|nr:kinase-like protein [Rhizophagus irregularis]